MKASQKTMAQPVAGEEPHRRDLITIGKTQEMLSALIKAPVLSEQMLARPPIAFIHAVFESVRKATGFGEGLFNSENPPTDRADKLRFIVKLIGCIAIALMSREIEILATPVGIISGTDFFGANALLQGLARAATHALDPDAVTKTVAIGDLALYERALVLRRTIVRWQLLVRERIAKKRDTLLDTQISLERPSTDDVPHALTKKKETARHKEALAFQEEEKQKQLAASLAQQKEKQRAKEAECAAKLAQVRAAEEHVRVQQSLLEAQYEEMKKREVRAKKLTQRAQKQLRAAKEQHDREQRLKQYNAKLLDDMRKAKRMMQQKCDESSCKPDAASVATSTTKTVNSSTTMMTSQTNTTLGTDYLAGVKIHKKKKRTRPVPKFPTVHTAEEDLRRAYEALGGHGGIFGRFFQERIADTNERTQQNDTAEAQEEDMNILDDALLQRLLTVQRKRNNFKKSTSPPETEDEDDSDSVIQAAMAMIKDSDPETPKKPPSLPALVHTSDKPIKPKTKSTPVVPKPTPKPPILQGPSNIKKEIPTGANKTKSVPPKSSSRPAPTTTTAATKVPKKPKVPPASYQVQCGARADNNTWLNKFDRDFGRAMKELERVR